jgi:hypothetical protein
MPLTPLTSNSSASRSADVSSTTSSTRVAQPQAPRTDVHRDGFTQAPNTSSTTTSPVEQSKTIAAAKQWASKLQEKQGLLANEIKDKKASLSGVLNSKIGLLQTALHHGNTDLVASLAAYERALAKAGGRRESVVTPRMTNEEFLVRVLQHLIGKKEVTLADWEKVETKSRLGQADSPFNLREAYRKHLADGKAVYQNSAQSREKLKELEDKRSKSSQVAHEVAREIKELQSTNAKQVAQKEKTDKNIGKLVKGGKQNRDEVNKETKAYIALVDSLAKLNVLSAKKAKVGKTLESDLQSMSDKIKEQLDEVSVVFDEVYVYEKKLALFETLLGYDIERLGGDDVRVRFIKTAIAKTTKDINDDMDKTQKQLDAVSTSLNALMGEVKAFESTTSSWDRYWIKRKIKKILETAQSA